jgi:two-component system, OmpR family, sensor kinase
MAEGVGRLAPRGLRRRLAAWVALVVVASSAITFVVVYRGTESDLRGQIDRELSGDLAELSHALLEAGHSPTALQHAATRYIKGQPFQTSSNVLFVVVPGQTVLTNAPELISRATPDDGESAIEQQAENHATGRVLIAPAGYSTLRLPDVGELRLLKRRVKVKGGPAVTLGAGESLASVASARQGLLRAYILAGALALLGALIGALLIGSRFTRPLRRMAAVAARVDAGDLHPRIHDVGRRGDEVQVLADAFNHMLDRLTDAFAGQRAFVADASHELRTPLTVIRGQLEVLATQSDPPGSEVRRVEMLVQAEIARITRLVDDLLLLAKAEQTEFLREEGVDLRTFVAELWDGVSLIARRRFELGPVPEGTLRADPDRLAQALRNLISNAIDHTEPDVGLVRLSIQLRPEMPRAGIAFIVEDDGPGIPDDQWERVFDRFHRTDAARDRASGGTGLGLAIVRAIAEAHGGTVKAGAAQARGARFTLQLPGFTPKPPSSAGGERRAGQTRQGQVSSSGVADLHEAAMVEGEDPVKAGKVSDLGVREHEQPPVLRGRQ